jgi:protein gp37
MNATGIEWTDATSNLLKYRDAAGKVVWHCEKVSPGCRGCYAEAIAERFGKGGPFTPVSTRKVTPFFDEVEAGRLLRSKKLTGKRVFVDDMTDLFGPWVPDEIIHRHFAVFALRPDVTFQVLTKRPERMAEYFTADGGFGPWGRVEHYARHIATIPTGRTLAVWGGKNLPNCWLGTSVEDQARADSRIPHLLRCPAAVRFLSCEPLLGPVRLPMDNCNPACPGDPSACLVGASGCGCRLDWIIIGGESGPGSRPCDVAWVRALLGQCRAAGVPAFCKQLGANVVTNGCTAPGEHWPNEKWAGELVTLPGGQSCGWRVRLRDRKGGDPAEWAEDLRVREFPAPGAPP